MAVFNITSIGLICIAHNLNESLDLVGNPIVFPTTFNLGASAINYAEEIERLMKLKDLEQGVYLMPPFGRYEVTLSYLRCFQKIK
jgi:hypothetical protein